MLLWGRFCRGSCALVFKPLAERFDLLLRIRREQVLNGYVGRRNQNRFRVRESVKPGLAVVVTDTGISDPAKGHGFDKQVNVYLIDRAAAEGQACEEVIDRLLISAEEEAGKRLRMLLHLANGRSHVLVDEDWEKRPKDLVLHDRVVPSHWVDNRGIEIACIRVRGPAYDDFLLIDQACQTFSGLGANDAGVVVRFALGVGPVQLDHRLLALSNKLLRDGFVHVGVSGRGAPLAAPGRSPPDNLFGCVGDIGGRVNKGWVLAPEFEKNRSQIFCGRLHDDLAALDAAGEEDEVERQLEKLRHLVFAAGDGSEGPRIEIFWNKIEQDLTGGGQTLGEFEDAWIASRNNLDSGVEEQGQWSIEWPDNQGDAVRFPIDFSSMPALPKGLGYNHIYGLHPLLQILLREGDGSYGRHNLEDFLLAGRLEVAAHRSLKNLGVLIAQVLKACQLVDAPLVRLSRIRIEICFLLIEDFLELVHLSLLRVAVVEAALQQRCEPFRPS